MASAAEQLYTLQGVADDLRDDGRGRLDFRHITLEVGLFPQTSGSARVQLGGADVLVAVMTELAEPIAESPDMGCVRVSIGCVSGSVASRLPDYSAPNPDDRISWLEASLQMLYTNKTIPDALRALCIVPGAQCWKLRIHVQLLDVDGCPLDAISIGVAAALRSTRIPKISATTSTADNEEPSHKKRRSGPGAQLDLELDESLDESVPFDSRSVACASLDVASCVMCSHHTYSPLLQRNPTLHHAGQHR